MEEEGGQQKTKLGQLRRMMWSMRKIGLLEKDFLMEKISFEIDLIYKYRLRPRNLKRFCKELKILKNKLWIS
jgi:hypothetical protein